MLSEPLVEFLPSRPKNFVQKYIAVFYVEAIYLLYGLSQIIVRALSIIQGKQRLRPENLLIFLELSIFMTIAPSHKVITIHHHISYLHSICVIVVGNHCMDYYFYDEFILVHCCLKQFCSSSPRRFS